MIEQVTEPAPTTGVALRDYVERLLLQVLAAMPAGWSALRDATLPGLEGGPPERIGLLLVHPRVGVAVLDLMPGPTIEDAALRLGRVLEASGWSVQFGGLPPIIHLCVPLRALRGLETWLEQTFGEQPPLALRRDDWVAALQRLLGATPLLRSGLASGRLPGRPTRPQGTAARHSKAISPGLRGLFWFWGGLALIAISGAALLQFLGPLDEAPPRDGPEFVAVPPRSPPALLPLLLPALPPAEAPQLDRKDPLSDFGAEPAPQTSPPAETLTAVAPVPDEAPQDARPAAAAEPPAEAAAPPRAVATGLSDAESGFSLTEAASPALAEPAAAFPDAPKLPSVAPPAEPAATIPDAPKLPSVPPPAEPNGVPPSASVPSVAAPPAPLLLPHPPSPPSAAGVAPPEPPALVDAVMSPGPPAPEPPPAAEAAGSSAPSAFSRLEDGPPSAPPAVASAGGVLDAAEGAPGKEGAGLSEVPAMPANAALRTAEGNSPPGDGLIAPPAPLGSAAGTAAGPAPGEGGGRDAPAIPVVEAEPPVPSEPVAATTAMAEPVPSEPKALGSQETEQAASSGFARPPAAVPAPSLTSAASLELRGREPALPVPPTPEGESALAEARPAEAATAGRPNKPGAVVSSPATLSVPDTTAGPGLVAPQGRAGVPPEGAALPPGLPAGTPPVLQLVTILRRGDAMLAVGDVSAARLLYARAAAAGSGEAMLALGKVQDPLFLEEIGARGTLGDATLAISWYRRAQAQGVSEARDRLARHGVRPEE